MPSTHENRSKRSELWIIIGWILIALKSIAVWLVINAYHDKVPFHPFWIIIPTVMFGLLATALYIWRE